MALCKVLGVLCALTSQPTLEGYAYALDGDTLYVQGQSVRLWGVDAEELGEPNGHRARDALQHIVLGATVVCTVTGTSHKREVARCSIAGVDVGETLIKAGAALDCPRYSGGHYKAAEPALSRVRLMQKGYCER